MAAMVQTMNDRPKRKGWRRPLSALALAAAALALTAAPAAALPGGNLLTNPGAEAEPVREEFSATYPYGKPGLPSGWSQLKLEGSAPSEARPRPYDACWTAGTNEAAVVEGYGAEAIGGGARLFDPGEDELSELSQDYAVTAEASGQRLLIGGYFGGLAVGNPEIFEEEGLGAVLIAQFLNSEEKEIGRIETTRVSVADHGNVEAFLPREASGAVPSGTASIRFVLRQLQGGSDLVANSFADNLFATFDAGAPAPAVATGDATCPYKAPPSSSGPGSPAPSPAPAPPATPAVQITKAPPKETAEAKAPFSFTGTPGGSFECSLDGGAFKPCTSGTDFGPVQPGDHRFEVREVLGGKAGPPAAYDWTVDLPKACVLRVARARVFAYSKRNAARLVIHYTSYKPARIDVSYKLAGSKGALDLGSTSAQFSKAGVFRLPENLSTSQAAKLKAAKSFSVKFKIPGTPSNCARYYTKKLTIPQRVSGQTVWFQSDSRFAP
jgi:hypothetical protein